MNYVLYNEFIGEKKTVASTLSKYFLRNFELKKKWMCNRESSIVVFVRSLERMFGTERDGVSVSTLSLL